MFREYHRWHSPSLGRDMELIVAGHAGARVIVFPTSQGRFFDWENRRMFDVLGEQLAQGWLQLYCVDSVDAETWYAKWRPPAERARRHNDYDRYILTEVLPFGAARNPNPFVITTGASFGAYHAVNFAFRHPEAVGRCVGMSGLYDMKRFTDGYFDDEVYFNSPTDYIPGEQDPERLDALRRVDIVLVTGRDDPNFANNEQLSADLNAKGIPHRFYPWDGWSHDWPYWEQMAKHYL